MWLPENSVEVISHQTKIDTSTSQPHLKKCNILTEQVKLKGSQIQTESITICTQLQT